VPHAASIVEATRGTPSSPAPPIAARRITRAVRRSASHEVTTVPVNVRRSRRAVRSYQPPDHPASTFSQPRHPRRRPVGPCGFYRLASSVFSISLFEDAAPRVIRVRFLFGSRAGPACGRYRDLAGTLRSRRRSWDFLTPFAVLLRFPGERAFKRLQPTCRFASDPPRVSSSRDPSVRRIKGFGRGSWVWPREPAVPCDLPTPL
jgi:hypothetical protein